MSSEHDRRSPRVVDLERSGADPPFDYPDYVGDAPARSEGAARDPAAYALRADRPRLRRRGASASSTTTSRASTRASRSASGSSSAGRVLGTRRQAAARPARRDLAGERRRPLPARGRHPRRAARPELLRRGPLPHRRRRLVPLRHGQARRVPVGEPPERLAAEPHPLLALRARVHRAARDADVLPGRPALRLRPDLQRRSATSGRASASSAASTSRSPSRTGRSATASTSCWAAARRRRCEEHDD